MYTLEIACFNQASAMAAAAAGAHRLELCDNPAEGGTTLPYGVLKVLRQTLSVTMFPIIRSRGGHFVFAPYEVEAMTQDILACKAMGYEGVVVGALNADGHINYEATARWVEAAYPMEVTFHRAFDRCIDTDKALETIIQVGCTRLLTSGQKPDVNQATDTIQHYIAQANGRLIIMPGSGVKSASIARLAAATGAVEFHASARQQVDEPYYVPATMEEQLSQTMADATEVAALRASLDAFFADKELGHL